MVFRLVNACFSFGLQARAPSISNKTDIHLSKFSKFNEAHHDNIDETSEEHSHKHRHSKDSEEHGHNHDHSKFTQAQIQLVIQNREVKFNCFEINTTQNFNEKSFVSNPHPFEIFRPPIV